MKNSQAKVYRQTGYTQASMTTLEELTLIRAPIERCFDLSLSVEVHELGNVHFGEQAVPLAGKTSGVMALGESVTWRARHFGVRQRLTSQITRLDRPHAFQDTMLSGAFAYMQHDHFFRERSDGITEMRDFFRYAAPLPLLGVIAERLVLDRYMRNLLRERNAVVRQVAESDEWGRYVK
jgi:ligand-binding SRPBCC domain-containing protein